MMDYVDLIKFIKLEKSLQDRAVIVGGGSYGGMLAAWLRMKYPQWFQGALASSAPILFFEGYVDPEAYDNIATQDYAKADPECPVMIKNGFEMLAGLKNIPDSYDQIAKIFNLCKVPTSSVEIDALINTLNGSFGTMAMVDYPYPTDFIEPLPGWPINYSCAQAKLAKEQYVGQPLEDLYPINAAG
jgi:lysosomal Pro-X carboxypeptidase